jgi:hypothetical protein
MSFGFSSFFRGVIQMNANNGFVVTPWKVKGDIDYQKLVHRFGTELIDKARALMSDFICMLTLKKF